MNDCKLFINESVPKILFHFLVNTKTLTKRQLYSVWTYDEKIMAKMNNHTRQRYRYILRLCYA